MDTTTSIELTSAHEVAPEALHAFYETGMMGERPRLPDIWPWLYRTEFHDRKIPLVLVDGDRVIGHAGIIPFRVELEGESYTASWFIDFALLPEYQRKGLGGRMTKAWMDFADLYVTFCNEKSIGVFKKLGWHETFDTYYHRLFLRPFDHPKIADKLPSVAQAVLNRLSRPVMNLHYRRHAASVDEVRVEAPTAESMKAFETVRTVEPGTVIPIRDEAYLGWRVLDSPNRDAYFVFSVSGLFVQVLVRHNASADPPYLDALWISDTSDAEIVRRLLATLAVWGQREGYAYIRFYTSDAALSEDIETNLRSVVRQPRYAFYSRDEGLFNRLVEHPRWHWQLIDSDFEEF